MVNHRVFYYLGIPGGVSSTIIWFFSWMIQKGLMKPTGVLTGYPAGLHTDQIFGLFILPVLTGYIFKLLTGELTAKTAKILLILFLVGELLLYPLSITPERLPFYMLLALLYGGLFFLILQVANQTKSISDIRNLLLLSSLGAAFLGLVFMLYFEGSKPIGFSKAGRSLLFYGMLPPLFFAFAGNYTSQLTGKTFSSSMASRLALAAFILTFALEFIYIVILRKPPYPLFTGVVRLLATLVWAWEFLPLKEGIAYRNLKILGFTLSGYLLVLGMAGSALGAEHKAHLAHLFFISAAAPFLMMYTKEQEPGQMLANGRWFYIVFWGLMGMASTTRATAHFWPHIFHSHLMYASVIFTAGVILWGVILFRGGERQA